MSRYEAAALIKPFLDRFTEVTDELQCLIDGFKKELANLLGVNRSPARHLSNWPIPIIKG